MEVVVTFAVAVVLVLCSVTRSNAATAQPSGGDGGEGDAHKMPCIKKLMPCQPYLHSVTPPPPPSCCVPLKEIVDKDVTCLCAVFNNVDMLKSLNLTKENALDLPKACGTNADISQCKASSGNATHHSMSPESSTGMNESDPIGAAASATTIKTTSSATTTINFAGLSFASAFMATLFFSY